MIGRHDWVLFATLAREEWRLHTRLFGGARFALFPVVIAALTSAGALALVETGTSSTGVIAGIHLFAFAFGLYSGTAGFVGSDMLENVFGEFTLVLASSTTLPVGRRRLLGHFLVKDALFYAVTIVLPLAIAIVPLEGLSQTSPLSVLVLWCSLSLVFAVGMTLTVVLIALNTRGVPGWSLGLAGGVVVVAGWLTGVVDDHWQAIVLAEGTLLEALGIFVLTVVVAGAALAVYDPAYAKPTKQATNRFGQLEARLETEDGLVTKTLLDLARSSGGVWKPFVSAAILLTLVAFLVTVVRGITGIEPAPGIFFGGVLGLTAFTTYNWLTQFDTVESYLAYPVSVEAVFRAKRTAFLLVGVPTMALPYLVAIVVFRATLLDAITGAIVLVGFALYYYGLTVFIAGFNPNEFLFDALRFLLFTLGVALPLVPTLVGGFVVVPPSLPLALVLSAAGICAGVVGLWLSSRAGPRWRIRYRRGEE